MSTWSTPTIPRVLDLFLANGVTTVRNIDGRPYNLEWRDRIARGEMRGPTIHTAGPILDGDPPLRDDNLAMGSADDARQAVRDQAAAGYDFVKIYTNLSGESYAAALKTAADVGLPVAGHVPRGVAVDEMLVSGIRSIEHVSELGIWSTPSLAGRPGDGLRGCRRPGFLGVVGDAASRPHGCRRLGARGGRPVEPLASRERASGRRCVSARRHRYAESVRRARLFPARRAGQLRSGGVRPWTDPRAGYARRRAIP